MKTAEVLWSGNITSGGTATLSKNMFNYRKIVLDFGISGNAQAVGLVEVSPAILRYHWTDGSSYYYSWTNPSGASNTGNDVNIKFPTEWTIKIDAAHGGGSWNSPPHLYHVYGLN